MCSPPRAYCNLHFTIYIIYAFTPPNAPGFPFTQRFRIVNLSRLIGNDSSDRRASIVCAFHHAAKAVVAATHDSVAKRASVRVGCTWKVFALAPGRVRLRLIYNRKTGITLAERERDEHGFEAVDNLFSSPEKDVNNVPAKGVNGRNHAESDEEQTMEIDDGIPHPMKHQLHRDHVALC